MEKNSDPARATATAASPPITRAWTRASRVNGVTGGGTAAWAASAGDIDGAPARHSSQPGAPLTPAMVRAGTAGGPPPSGRFAYRGTSNL